MKYKKICKDCGKKFELTPNPSPKTEGLMTGKKGTNHLQRLCDNCWTKRRCKPHPNKGRKKFGKRGSEGMGKIQKLKTYDELRKENDILTKRVIKLLDLIQVLRRKK